MKKKIIYGILHEVFLWITMFFGAGGVSGLLLSELLNVKIGLFCWICCFGALPATIIRAVFHRLEINEYKKERYFNND